MAQEELAISTAPVLVGATSGPGRRRALAPRTLVLRTFAVSGIGGEPLVMPGALARVAGSADNPEVSMQVGSGSKDAWVLADGPVEAVQPAAAAQPPGRR